MLVLLSKGMSAFGKLGLNDWAPRFQEEMRIWADSYELEASDWSFRAALISSRQSCLRNVPVCGLVFIDYEIRRRPMQCQTPRNSLSPVSSLRSGTPHPFLNLGATKPSQPEARPQPFERRAFNPNPQSPRQRRPPPSTSHIASIIVVK